MNPLSGMCLNSLEILLEKTKIAACVGILNFNNPLGCLMPDANKQRLVETLARRNVPLIENDVYGDLHFAEIRPRAAKSFDQTGLVLLCSSVSKTLAPGYRVGWTVPGKFKTEVEKLQLVTTLSTPALPQMTVAEFMQSGLYDRHLRQLRTALAAQIERITLAITEYFPQNVKMTRPQGGFVLWVELPGKIDATKLQTAALAENISINPGSLFSASGRYRNFIRLSCGHPWSDKLVEAFKRLASLITKC